MLYLSVLNDVSYMKISGIRSGLILLLVFPFFAGAGNISFIPLPQDLLPSGEVASLYQDREGFIWMATYSGVVRYDGYQSVGYGLSDDCADIYESFHGLCEDNEGNLYIGTEKGLLMLDKNCGKIRKVIHPEIEALNVTDIVTDGDGRLWVCGDNGVFRKDANGEYIKMELRRYATEESLTDAVDMVVGPQGNIWITSWRRGLCRYDLNTGRIYRYTDGDLLHSYVLHCDGNSNLWIGTWGRGLLKVSLDDLDDDRLSYVKYAHQPGRSSSLLDDIIYDIDQDTEGNIWVGSRSGLSILSNMEKGVFQNEYPRDAYGCLPYNEVNAILRTTDGTMWLGMMGGGACRVERLGGVMTSDIVFMNIDNVRDEYKTSSVKSIQQIDPNRYWFGLSGRGMISYDLRTAQFTNYSDMPYFAGFPTISTVDCILRRKSTGEYCFGTYENGLWLYDPFSNDATVINCTTRNTMYDDCIQALEEDYDDNIWIGTSRGFYVMDTLNQVRALDDAGSELAHCKISDIVADSTRANTIWLATDCHGILRATYSDEKIRARSYIVEGKHAVSQFISVHADSNGKVWAGSAHDGLYVYNQDLDSFEKVNNCAFLDGKGVLNISEGPAGKIWVTTKNQVFSFAGDRLLFYHDMSGNDTFSFFNRNTSFYLPEENKMVFGYNRGVALFPSESIAREPGVSDCAITDFCCNGLSFRDKSDSRSVSVIGDLNSDDVKVVVSAYRPEIDIRFSLFNFRSTYDAVFTYRLSREGDLNGDWYITSGKENVASFRDLKPGKYCFEVYGNGSASEESTPVEVLAFVVKNGWGRYWWVLTLFLLSAAAMIWLCRRSGRPVGHVREVPVEPVSEQPVPDAETDDSEIVSMSFNVRRIELTPLNQLFMQKVLKVVNEHLADSEFRQSDFAREMAVSQTILTEKIKTLTGNTPMAFLTSMRLKMAHTLIQEVKDGIQVADLAYSVGFNDAKYFSKKFKEQYGVSPNKMMQSIKNSKV